uniref:Tetrahydrofolate dehydrogenase/cyclohydrolase catalytic domain-containing protein n=1 Tax=Romanomermis culicivorax TaxID=13658 RepID=A0A915K0H5_ROMCU
MAKIIDGKQLADNLQAELRDEILKIREKTAPDFDFRPSLAVVQVGDRPDSTVYIRNKLRAAEKIGVAARLVNHNFPLKFQYPSKSGLNLHSFDENWRKIMIFR